MRVIAGLLMLVACGQVLAFPAPRQRRPDPRENPIVGSWDIQWGGCVVIVKGGENAFKVRNILANAGLLDTTNRIDHL